jgi:hypothetical protein
MRKVLLIAGIFVAVTVVPPAISHAQNVETGKPQANALQHKEAVLPTVDYDKTESTDAHQRARRNARGKRYDGSLRVGEPHPEAGAKGILDSWMQKVPALPTVISDTIIIGEISDAHAYLSPDKTGIYSEYTAHVEQVVKRYAKRPISVNGVVDSQREGGRVRFPSGRVQSYITHYQGVPVIGRRYVLFLKSNEGSVTFTLITGYELRDGRIYPLDGVDLSPGATELEQFAAYKEADETSFFRDLEAAMSPPELAPKK